MPRRSSIGKNPLDWIGVPPENAPPRNSGNQSGQYSSATVTSTTTAINKKNSDTSTPVTTPAREVQELIRVEDTHGPDSGRNDPRSENVGLPLLPGTDDSTLERELLLMDVVGFDQRPGRRSRSNQVLLLLIFIFALAGCGMFFFVEARKRWNDQVLTLRDTIHSLEEETASKKTIFEQVIKSKDAVIAEKQALIQDLQEIHGKSIEELKKAWSETRKLQEKYSSFFRVVFSAASAAKATEAGTPVKSPALSEASSITTAKTPISQSESRSGATGKNRGDTEKLLVKEDPGKSKKDS